MTYSPFKIFILYILPGEIVELPTDADLKGALVALLRLQRTYLISTQDLAEGKVMYSVIWILKYDKNIKI